MDAPEVVIKSGSSRGELYLQRGLSLPLFAASGLFGLVGVVMVVSRLVGDPKSPWVMGAVVASVGWGCGWLASVLWSGRSIPNWFLQGFGLTLMGGWAWAVVMMVWNGRSEEAVGSLMMMVICCSQWPFTLGSKKKKAPDPEL